MKTTERLLLVPLSRPQMENLLRGNAPEGILYAGEPLEDVLASVIRAQLVAMDEIPEQAQWCRIWLFVDRMLGKAVGSACFKGGPDGQGSVEIGYGIGETWQGQGYASEGVCGLSYWGLSQPGVLRVTARTEAGNLASQRVLGKAGFVRDGEVDGLLAWTLARHEPFVCPVCRGTLAAVGGSLRCAKRHTVDIARQGYVNLLRKKPDTVYEDKALFEARRKAYRAGFFAPVVEAVRAKLPGGVLLDAGCGEGSLLAALTEDGAREGIGLDIARTAIQMAAGTYKRRHFCVGDLCVIPLADAAVGAIINVLTPANYGEFSRVLTNGGMLIKVVPNAGHLQEIRALAGKSPYAHTLAETLSVFEKSFTLEEQKMIRYSVPCDVDLASAVYAMTPLTAHECPASPGAGDITVDVTMLVGRVRR